MLEIHLYFHLRVTLLLKSQRSVQPLKPEILSYKRKKRRGGSGHTGYLGILWNFMWFITGCAGISFVGILQRWHNETNCMLIKCFGQCQIKEKPIPNEDIVSVIISKSKEVSKHGCEWSFHFNLFQSFHFKMTLAGFSSCYEFMTSLILWTVKRIFLRNLLKFFVNFYDYLMSIGWKGNFHNYENIFIDENERCQ